MPTAYKGKLRIACRVALCIQDPAKADATETCFTCPEAACEILDLDDRVILAIGQLMAKLLRDTPSPGFMTGGVLQENDTVPTVLLPGEILRDGSAPPDNGEPEPVTEKRKKKR